MTVRADLVELVACVADPARRLDAAIWLQRQSGVEAVLVFAMDPSRVGKLVPAPGFAPTHAGGPGWRDLLARAIEPGVHLGAIAYPSRERILPAAALSRGGIVAVAVGGDAAAIETIDRALEPVFPLLAATLVAEVANAALRADLAIAHATAARSVELARALDVARGHAEAATRVKDDFLAMLGHELRNPLAPIVTALHLLRTRGGLTREHDVIERQVAHLMRLVDDLLDVSRITRGKVELRREVVELSSVVRRALEISQPLLDAKRHVVHAQVPDTGLPVHGDPARLAQVVSNLLTNAAKYSDDQTPISIVCERHASSVRLSVVDQGIGIAPSLLQAIFEQFMQTPQGIDRAQGGLGLGLAIVKSLVDLHGGTVTAHSDGPGRGSRFVVELPLSNLSPTAEPTPFGPEARPDSTDRHEGTVRVLIVDDNEDAADLLDFALAQQGFITRCAPSGAAALAEVERFEPEVALVDIGLPGMDGYELARLLREQRPRIGLVALTGYGQESDKAKTRRAGFDAHLVKPVELDVVRSAIANVLAAR